MLFSLLLIIQEPTCDTTACLVFSFGHWNALAPCAVVWSCSDIAGRGLLIVRGFNVVCKGSRHSRKRKIYDTFSPSDFLEHEQNETSVFAWTLIAASAFVLRIPRVNGCIEIAALYDVKRWYHISYHIHLGIFGLSELHLNEILKDLFSQWSILFWSFHVDHSLDTCSWNFYPDKMKLNWDAAMASYTAH